MIKKDFNRYRTWSFNLKRMPKEKIERPKILDLMLEYAEKFDKEFVFAREDFYDINGKVYLGEITFTPSNALSFFKNREQRLFMGSLIDLTKIKPHLFNK